MQAAEAITRLIAIADRQKSTSGTFAISPTSEFQQDLPTQDEELDHVAVHIAQAMLNSMIVVARFRLFVRIESGDYKGAEYTVCATDVNSIRGAVKGLRFPRRDIYLQLWEQRATGADMLLGYQGSTGDRVRDRNALELWIESLGQFDVPLN